VDRAPVTEFQRSVDSIESLCLRLTLKRPFKMTANSLGSSLFFGTDTFLTNVWIYLEWTLLLEGSRWGVVLANKNHHRPKLRFSKKKKCRPLCAVARDLMPSGRRDCQLGSEA